MKLARFKEAVGQSGPVRRLRGWLLRLPPATALLLFLIPEVTSRTGTAVSAWLLLHGQAWQALAVYALSKLVAGLAALWIYSVCEPALLRIAWFARLHGMVMRQRDAILAWSRRSSLSPSRWRQTPPATERPKPEERP